jgi:nicotinamidase-related amidase
MSLNLEYGSKIAYVYLSMTRNRFLLSSDQLELLLAFEESKGLSHLAETMAKDPSVISRGLQKIAESYPVLIKIRGRWELTPLGRELNVFTKEHTLKQEILLGSSVKQKSSKEKFEDSVLIVINAQCGLLDATQLGRNNSDAEKNISKLISHWREKKRKVFHIKHVSDNPSSFFYRSSKGCDFLPGLTPFAGETVVEKMKSSAFENTELEEILKTIEPAHIVLAGFTANECIDATARDASSLGFSTVVIGDATAMFDMKAPDGKLLRADRLHRLTLANLNAFYAKVVDTANVLS